jgi:iron complex transport system substrate-binding protein
MTPPSRVLAHRRRRRTGRCRAVAGAVALAVVLAACGSDDPSSDGASSAGAATSDDAAASSEPVATADISAPTSGTRAFVDVTGESIEVPDVAERIVAIHDINAGVQLLSLGAPVVGIATRDDGARPDVTRYFDLAGIAEVGLTYEPNVEAIAALRPDLIVGEGFDGAGMDQFMREGIQDALEQIAPVVYIDTFRPVEEVMADFEELVGDAATVSVEEQATEFESVLGELRELLGDSWSDVAVSAVFSGEPLSIPGPSDLVETDVLARTGVTFTQVVQDAAAQGGFIELSNERISELEADLLVVTTAFDQTLVESPLFQALEVVQAGQVYDIDEPSAGTHWTNYIAVAEDLLDELAAMDIDTGIV